MDELSLTHCKYECKYHIVFAPKFRRQIIYGMKYKYGNRHFQCKGYYVSTMGRNEMKIKEYIQNQLQEDLEQDQINMKEYIDPFLEDDDKKGKK